MAKDIIKRKHVRFHPLIYQYFRHGGDPTFGSVFNLVVERVSYFSFYCAVFVFFDVAPTNVSIKITVLSNTPFIYSRLGSRSQYQLTLTWHWPMERKGVHYLTKFRYFHYITKNLYVWKFSKILLPLIHSVFGFYCICLILIVWSIISSADLLFDCLWFHFTLFKPKYL